MLKQALAIAVLLCTAAGGVQAKEVMTRNIPVTQTVSPELQKLIGAKDPGLVEHAPENHKGMEEMGSRAGSPDRGHHSASARKARRHIRGRHHGRREDLHADPEDHRGSE